MQKLIKDPGSIIRALIVFLSFGVLLAVAWIHVRILRYTPDSLNYYAFAEGIANGFGLTGRILSLESDIPRALDLWPPGYPLAWGAFLFLGLDPTSAAQAVHLLAVLIMGISFLMLVPRKHWSVYAPTFVLFFAMYAPFTNNIFSYAWSESLTMAFLALGFGIESQNARRPFWQAALVGVCMAAAFLTRYAALAGFIAVAIARGIEFVWAKGRRWDYLKWFLVFGMSFGLTVSPWFIRNRVYFGRWTGFPHTPRGSGHSEIVLEHWKSVLPQLTDEIVFGVIGLACLILAIVRLLKPSTNEADEAPRFGALGLFPFIYLALLFELSKRVHFDGLGPRFFVLIAVSVLPLLSYEVARTMRLFRWVEKTACLCAVTLVLWVGLRYPCEQVQLPVGLKQIHVDYRKKVDWVLKNQTIDENTLLIGTDISALIFFTDAYILIDGYPEMGVLNLFSLSNYLEKHEKLFSRLYWIGKNFPFEKIGLFRGERVSSIPEVWLITRR